MMNRFLGKQHARTRTHAHTHSLFDSPGVGTHVADITSKLAGRQLAGRLENSRFHRKHSARVRQIVRRELVRGQ